MKELKKLGFSEYNSIDINFETWVKEYPNFKLTLGRHKKDHEGYYNVSIIDGDSEIFLYDCADIYDIKLLTKRFNFLFIDKRLSITV